MQYGGKDFKKTLNWFKIDFPYRPTSAVSLSKLYTPSPLKNIKIFEKSQEST